MTSTSGRRSIILAAVLPLVFGCELLAPIKPLPGIDAGREAGTTDGGRDADAAVDHDSRDAAMDRSDAREVGTTHDAGGEEAERDGGQDRYDAADGDADRGRSSDASPDTSADAPGDRRDAAGADSGHGDGGSDGVPPVVTCDPSMPFGEPVLVYGLNRDPGTEWSITVSPDELTAYVAVGSYWTLAHPQMAKRANRAEPFAALVPLTALNGPTFEQAMSVTEDGLTLFMESNRPDMNAPTRIYVSTRQNTDEPFGSPSDVQLEQGMPDEFDPYVLPDGSALYFTSNIVGLGFFSRAALDGTKAETPTLVLQYNARFPVVSADELTMYFGWNDPHTGIWGDIWIATRPSRDVPFGVPTNVSEVNTPDQEWPQWISPDGCRLYLTRQTSAGGAFSFVAERLRPIPPSASP